MFSMYAETATFTTKQLWHSSMKGVCTAKQQHMCSVPTAWPWRHYRSIMIRARSKSLTVNSFTVRFVSVGTALSESYKYV